MGTEKPEKKSGIKMFLILAGLVLLAVLIYGIMREKDKREAEELRKSEIRTNIKEYVHLTTNDYKVDPIKGISNVRISVNNTSDYLMDNISIQINYFKTSGELYKSEELHFSKIAPHSAATLPAPDSDRGTNVKARIIRINSDDLDM